MLAFSLTALIMMGWIVVRNHLASGTGLHYVDQFSAWIHMGESSAYSLFDLILSNVRFYLNELCVQQLFRWPSFLRHQLLNLTTIAFVVCGIFIGGITLWKKQQWRALLLATGFHILLLLFWTRQSGRYLYPLLPIFMFLFFSGVEFIVAKTPDVSPRLPYHDTFPGIQTPEKWHRRLVPLIAHGTARKRIVVTSLTGLILVLYVPTLHRIFQTSLFLQTPINTPIKTTYQWILNHTDHNNVFATLYDGRFYLYTDRQTYHLPSVNNPVVLYQWAEGRKIKYLLLESTESALNTTLQNSHFDNIPHRELINTLQTSPLFKIVYMNEAEETAIFQMVKLTHD
ncbi:MAG: hypothetical protein KCHDKBKB_01845 [Elusimicrobia bacterium]|nr:hypothetical protein [Elusimicrobiota bacterium]